MIAVLFGLQATPRRNKHEPLSSYPALSVWKVTSFVIESRGD